MLKEKIRLSDLQDEFEPQGIKVFPISAVTGKGCEGTAVPCKNIFWIPWMNKPIVFRAGILPGRRILLRENLPYTVEKLDDESILYVVEGPKIEKMLGYTNLESEKGFAFFQKFLKDSGILEELEQAGIEEGDTVRMYGLAI